MAERITISFAKRVLFKVFLSSDGKTAATGKTLAVVISKNGAAFANPSAGATNATEIGSGWYYFDASTTDTGTAGPLICRGTAAACDDSEVTFTVDAALGTLANQLALISSVGSPMQAGAHVQLSTTQDQYAPAVAGDSMALTTGERNSVADALLDRVDGIETGVSLRVAERRILSSTTGKCDGFPSGPGHFRNPADTKNRITVAVDGNGNRTSVTYDDS